MHRQHVLHVDLWPLHLWSWMPWPRSLLHQRHHRPSNTHNKWKIMKFSRARADVHSSSRHLAIATLVAITHLVWTELPLTLTHTLTEPTYPYSRVPVALFLSALINKMLHFSVLAQFAFVLSFVPLFYLQQHKRSACIHIQIVLLHLTCEKLVSALQSPLKSICYARVLMQVYSVLQSHKRCAIKIQINLVCARHLKSILLADDCDEARQRRCHYGGRICDSLLDLKIKIKKQK